MRNFVDLHTHSTASDGQLRPEEVVALAERKRLAALALTDHDTTNGLATATRAAEGLGLRFVPGVEISAAWPQGTLHILGLGIDPACAALAETLGRLRESRDMRNPQMLQKLGELGMSVTMAELKQQVEKIARQGEGKIGDTILFSGQAEAGRRKENSMVSPIFPSQPVLGRLHMALVMVRKGYVGSVKEAFEKYLGQGRPAYVDKERLTARQAIEAIHAGGGAAMLAHPPQLLYANSAQLERMLRSLIRDGLDGIEVYHSDNTPGQTRLHLDLARRFKLLICGGSDFHGNLKYEVRLGQPRVPLAAVEELFERIRL